MTSCCDDLADVVTKLAETHGNCRWCHHHQVQTGRNRTDGIEFAQQGSESSSHPIANDCGSDRLVDGERNAHLRGTIPARRVRRDAPQRERTAATNSAGRTNGVELGTESQRLDQALSLWRPLSRLERITLRPARSDMRWRNPCFLALRRLFG